MKHPTVILLTLFVLQINALPHPTLSRSSSENEDVNTNLKSKDTSESNSISAISKSDPKPTNDIAEKELKSTNSDIGSVPKDVRDVHTSHSNKNEEEPSTSDNKREEPPKPKSIDVENKELKSSLNNQETPAIARSNKDDGVTSGSGSIPDHIKIETMQQRPPSYYYDMFNIPIAALQAVSQFLGGTPTSTNYIRPPATSRPPLSKQNLRSPIEALSGTAGAVPASSGVTNTPNNVPNTPVLNLINQISQIASINPTGILLRIPTIQDIINIPISTLNAVSHFLAANYAAQPAPAISSPPVAASNVLPSKLPIEGAPEPNKVALKSGPILESLENIPDHSTLIGVTEEVASNANEQVSSQLQIKQILIADAKYYQDMINIPIATLKAVSNFLSTVSVDPSITALPSAAQENKIASENLPSPSIKAAEVTVDKIKSKLAGSPQISDSRSSENSVLGGRVDGRSNEDMMAPQDETRIR